MVPAFMPFGLFGVVNNVIQTTKLGKWMLSIGFSDADCDIPISFNDQTL